MRVLLVNYRYFISGGPETYMFAVSEMMEAAGHEIIPFSVRYDQNRETPWSSYFVDPIAGSDQVYFRDHSKSLLSLARGLQRAFYARDVYKCVRRLVDAARPDVALVQHYLRKLSPSVLVALKDSGVPIVVRLSDYGMICPESHMLRDGKVCRRCVTGGLSTCIRYRCVQNSYAVSAVTCLSMWHARWRKYFDLVDYFITPSSILRGQMIEGGYDGSRIFVLPTFVRASDSVASGVNGRRIVYVGRLSPEKGLHVLLDAYERLLQRPGLSDIDLLLAGEGEAPYVAELRARAASISSKARFLGMLDSNEVRSLLSSASLSVAPSLWYENVPNSMLESLAAGTPIVAAGLGSMAEVLRGSDAGVLFRPGDAADLATNLEELLQQPDTLRRMSRSARILAETRYSPEKHLAGLTEILEGAITRKMSSLGSSAQSHSTT